MPPVGFEPTIPVSALPEVYALDGAATGISQFFILAVIKMGQQATQYVIEWCIFQY
jgi:hypothetical protein